MAGVVVLPGAKIVEPNPEGPKAKGYKEADNKQAYMRKVLEDLMPRLDARDKGSPKGNLLASAEDTIDKANNKGTLGARFTSGYIDGVYDLLDSEGGRRRRRKTRKSRKTRKTRKLRR